MKPGFKCSRMLKTKGTLYGFLYLAIVFEMRLKKKIISSNKEPALLVPPLWASCFDSAWWKTTRTVSVWLFVRICCHLRGLFQIQPGLSDTPLSVLELWLELAVLSGNLLKQLTNTTHTHTHTSNEELGQIRQIYRMISTAIHLLSVHLLKVLRLRSSSPCTVAIGWVRPGYMKTKRSSTLWMEKIQINQKWDSYLELKRWSVCKQEGGKANTLQLFS